VIVGPQFLRLANILPDIDVEWLFSYPTIHRQKVPRKPGDNDSKTLFL